MIRDASLYRIRSNPSAQPSKHCLTQCNDLYLKAAPGSATEVVKASKKPPPPPPATQQTSALMDRTLGVPSVPITLTFLCH